MAAADRVIVVSATDPAALRDAQRTVAELLPQVSEIHLVMNRVQPKLIRKLRTSIDEAMDTAGLPLLGIVPEDKQVMLAAGQGLPLVLYAHKDAARAYLNIAKRLMGAKVPLLRIH
jgi:septum site-determining protein MinD